LPAASQNAGFAWSEGTVSAVRSVVSVTTFNGLGSALAAGGYFAFFYLAYAWALVLTALFAWTAACCIGGESP
jgi:hypothetical protein